MNCLIDLEERRSVNTNDAAALGSLLHLLLLMWLGIVQLMRKVSGLWGTGWMSVMNEHKSTAQHKRHNVLRVPGV